MTTHDEDKIIAQQARIEQLTNFIKYAQVSSGVCCCGDSMEGHPSPMTCGHSPVDMWDYHSGELLEAYPDDLSALRAHDEKLRAVFQAGDQLRAHINMLRDAFQTFIDEHEECQDADEWMAELCSIEALHVAGEALATTPEQSLAEYRNKVIEDCAKRAEAYAYMSQNFNALAEELRAMKEQP